MRLDLTTEEVLAIVAFGLWRLHLGCGGKIPALPEMEAEN